MLGLPFDLVRASGCFASHSASTQLFIVATRSVPRRRGRGRLLSSPNAPYAIRRDQSPSRPDQSSEQLLPDPPRFERIDSFAARTGHFLIGRKPTPPRRGLYCPWMLPLWPGFCRSIDATDRNA